VETADSLAPVEPSPQPTDELTEDGGDVDVVVAEADGAATDDVEIKVEEGDVVVDDLLVEDPVAGDLEAELAEVDGELARQILADTAGLTDEVVEVVADELVVADEPPSPELVPEPELSISEGYEQRLAEAEQVLDDVDGALVRLRDGTYGSCEVCGDAIADDLLAVRPTARACERHLPLAEAS